MNKNSENLKFLGVNVGIAVVILLILVIVIVKGMKNYTKHGQEIEVPQITGLYPSEAEMLLQSSGLNLEIIDSTFSSKVPLGTIVEQNPPMESKVKEGRAIYVVINASAQRRVVMPELHDISIRQAENMLKQLGLQVKDIVYEASEYRDLVLDVRQDSVPIETGTKVVEGSALTLVVGKGRGTEMVGVPDLGGMSLTSARSLLLSQHLTMGRAEYDETPEEEIKDEFIVYDQSPRAGNSLIEGGAVVVKLSRDKAKAITAGGQEDEEEFF